MPMCSSVMTSMTYDRPMTRGRIRMMKTRSLVEDIKKTIMEIDETKQIHMQLKVQEQNEMESEVKFACELCPKTYSTLLRFQQAQSKP